MTISCLYYLMHSKSKAKLLVATAISISQAVCRVHTADETKNSGTFQGP